MAATKTIKFLPDVFRTEPNRKFLNATLDQLVSEPKLKKINGYIGRKLSPPYKKSDSYIGENTADRQNYQLEPSLVIKNAVTDSVDFVTTYPDIINKIKYYGGLTDRHSRLFDNEYYTYDPHIDLDKFVNFSQYFWLANGPDAVTVSASSVSLSGTFNVTFNPINNSYSISGNGYAPNPALTLATGGTYDFVINSPGNNFYIQTNPGVTGYNPMAPNLYSRNILGVSNNGADQGTVRFSIPSLAAQVQWTSMPYAGTAEYATQLRYKDIQGSTPDELNYKLGGLDGVVTSLEGIRFIFVDNTSITDDDFWTDSPALVENGIVYFDTENVNAFETIPPYGRNDIYKISILPDINGVDRIVLTAITLVNDNQKVKVTAGAKNAGREYYSNAGILTEIPSITAPRTTLYYQNGNNASAVGVIKIIDPTDAHIDPVADIIGKLNYTSPNGIVFTNGLKITFDSTAVEPYTNKTFYVEGVGESIRLVNVNLLIVPELDYNLTTPDYLTIKRGCLDNNAWSRSNRWFHSDIIRLTAEYNNVDPVYDQALRANRPIIEFDVDLQLFNYGIKYKEPIDVLDTGVNHAYQQIQGEVVFVEGLEGTATAGSKVLTLTTGTTNGLQQGMKINVALETFDTRSLIAELSDPSYASWFTASTGDDNGNVYAVGGMDDNHSLVYAFDSDGTVKWKLNLDSTGPASVLWDNVPLGIEYVDGFLYILTHIQNTTKYETGIVKLNSSTGALVNQWVIKKTAVDLYNRDIVVLPNGTPAVLGTYYDTEWRVFVWTESWQKSFGQAEGYAAETLAYDAYDNSIYLQGSFYDVSISNYRIAIIKLNASTGTVIWKKFINNGDSVRRTLGSIAVDGAGNIYSTGQADDLAGADGVLTKLDSNGSIIWQVKQDMYNVSASWYYWPECAVDSNGDIIVTGVWSDGGATTDQLLMKLSKTDGSLVWTRRLSVPLNSYGIAPRTYPNSFDRNRKLRVNKTNVYYTGNHQPQPSGVHAFTSALPINGSGTGTYEIYLYAIDTQQSWVSLLGTTTDSASLLIEYAPALTADTSILGVTFDDVGNLAPIYTPTFTGDPVTGTGTDSVLGEGVAVEAADTAFSILLNVPSKNSGNITFTASMNNSTKESATFSIGAEDLVLANGNRVIFTEDLNSEVNNKIYKFTIELTTEPPGTLVYRAYITESEDPIVEAGNGVIAKSATNGKRQWHFNGVNWIESQQKLAVNQAPLFDVINNSGVSFGDTSVYPGSSFTGTKIFSYKEASAGVVDSVLGIPLSYRNFVSQGDIQFSNNFDADTFSYILSGSATESILINSGYLQKNLSLTTCRRLNIWTVNQNESRQNQIYTYQYDGTSNLFPIDYLPEADVNVPTIKVNVNNTILSIDDFNLVRAADRYAVQVNTEKLSINDIVFVSVYNRTNKSNNAYYEVPLNLDINTLNTNIETLTLGQMRNQLITLKNNNLNVVGSVPGANNLRDIKYLDKGGSILQHSAPAVYAGLFLNHPTMNFVNSLKLANREYSKFKIKFLELAATLELDQNNIAASVDDILMSINAVKNESFSWHYSDMVPYGDTDKVSVPTYVVLNPDIKSYEINNIFVDTEVSNKSALVYITRTIDGVTTKTLLVKDKDFYFNQDRPAITFNDTFNLLYDDLIDIVEYNSTDGCYVPETPTKLGLYPKFVPEIFVDNTYRDPITVIQGHDGSITPAFGDFRDQLLLELERRIYNNIKVNYDSTVFDIYSYLPGKFRITDYSLDEFNKVLTQGFLSWVGNNRIDFTTNSTFEASDPFTWNYRRFRDVVTGESLPGSWRSIYRYFYDTDRPHTHPWEMLGFSEKPTWWEDRYGPAPYTGGNLVLWSDLSLGYIHAGPRAGIDLKYQRPNLSRYIPVDENGNLISPEKILVTDFDSAKASVSWSVGDVGPAEAAWRRSSDYPYAIQLALALCKPAKYFALLMNVSTYRRNPITSQFEIKNTKQHISPNKIEVHSYVNSNGTVTRGVGYLNWIRDYIKNLGIGEAAMTIKDNLAALNVQLSYKLAGFTDKKFISLLAEQNSPSSINESIAVPDENYRIELYKGSPVNKIVYSAVIVEKTPTGFSVTGYNSNDPYFYIIPSQVNNNAYSITVGKKTGVIYKDFKNAKYIIPYGFEFSTTQQVVDFLVGYQRYLQSQGFVFVDRDNDLNEEKTWILSAKEFLYWAAQGWRPGSLIVLSPVSTQLKVYDTGAVVDEIVNTPYASRILDINFKNITKNHFSVNRENGLFTFTSNKNQTVGLAELDLIQYEHLLILDNITVFRDVIYASELGNRQYRLKLVGAKTADWNGSLELPGFVYNSGYVDSWQSGRDYLKGAVVQHKSRYYTALQDIPAATEFQTTNWQIIASSELKSGMLNNFATNSAQSLNYYDIDNQPVDESLQLFSNGLIGFRNRDYFTNLGIDSTTQSKFYQGFIKQKGSNNSIRAFQGATFSNLNTSINIYENWAVRVGEYGATDVNQSTEVVLDDTVFTNNPAAFQFVDLTTEAQAEIPSISESQIFKRSSEYQAKLFRAESAAEPTLLKPLPVAGFVHLDDIDATVFDLRNYEDLTNIVNKIGTGYKIYVARDFNKQWNVYRASIVSSGIRDLTFNIDNLAQLTTNAEHGLTAGDVVVIKNFDSRFDGVYQIHSIKNSVSFYITVDTNLQELIDAQTIYGDGGLLFNLTSLKLETPAGVGLITPAAGWIPGDKVWVSTIDAAGNWGVYNKIDAWEFKNVITLPANQYTGEDQFGYSISLNPTGQIMYAGAPQSSGSGRVAEYTRNLENNWQQTGIVLAKGTGLSGFGKTIANGGGILAVGAPDSNTNQGYVYLFKNGLIVQLLSLPDGAADDRFGHSIAMSDDGYVLYVGAPGKNQVHTYVLAPPRTVNLQVFPDPVTDANPPDGYRTAFIVDFSIDTAISVVVRSIITASEYIPYVDYTLRKVTSTIKTITSSGTAPAGSGLYLNVSSTTTGVGTGATFNVQFSGGSYTVTVNNPGSGYLVDDTLTIAGTAVGGTTTNNITITVTAIRAGMKNFTVAGSAPAGSYTVYNVPAITLTGSGSGAKFTVSVSTSTYTLTLVDPGTGYAIGDTVGIAGATVGGTNPVNDILITITSLQQANLIDFAIAPNSSTQFSVVARDTYYKKLDVLSPTITDGTTSGFGSGVSCSTDGTGILVGAANTYYGSNTDLGSAHVYHRTVTKFIADGLSGTFTADDDLAATYRVLRNGTELVENVDYYVIGARIIQFNSALIPVTGTEIQIETNQFVLDQTVYSTTYGEQPEKFGSTVAICETGCNLYVASSDYREPNYLRGKVSRYINIGRVYGEVLGNRDFSTILPATQIVAGKSYRIASLGDTPTDFTIVGASSNIAGITFTATLSGTVLSGTGTVYPAIIPGQTLIINGKSITFLDSTLTSIVNQINTGDIAGVTASIVGGKIKINSSILVKNKKLIILPGRTGTVLTDLGLDELYKFVQVLKHPDSDSQGFGSALAVDQSTNTLAIASDSADIKEPTQIDALIGTTYDSGSTNFVDIVKDSGTVFIYNEMAEPHESESNPALFVYTQKLSGPDIDSNFIFGDGVDIYGDILAVGASRDNREVAAGGSVYTFYNENAKSGWNLIRQKEERVSVDAVTSSFIYNKVSQNIINFFDQYDPAKGKVLGVADQEIDYREEYDPASYNTSTNTNTILNTEFYWSTLQVGKTWWDLSTVSYIDYEQDTLQYRLKNWGSMFPGSQINIYEWVESNFLPSRYVISGGDGVPKHEDDSAYTAVTLVDPTTGMITQKYYFWVKGKTFVDSNIARRTISTSKLETYLKNPRDQDIPYLALLARNSVALYNCTKYLTGQNVILHINTAESRNPNLIHNEYQLILQGNPILDRLPTRVVSKLKDSLVGVNATGQLVPDISLSVENRTGILLRPRQSLFLNRNAALKAFVMLANSIFLDYPILLITNASMLNTEDPAPTIGIDAQVASTTELSYINTESFPSGYTVLIPSDSNNNGKWSLYKFNTDTQEFELFKVQSYKTKLFWNALDWYSSDYVIGSPIAHTVNRYADLQTVALEAGQYAKILDNGNGQWLIYQINADGSLTLAAAQNATLEIDPKLYDPTIISGFDVTVFDQGAFDPEPSIEIGQIFDSINQEIFINDLALKFNDLFFAMVNYIFTEQKSPDWIFKTSFIDVYHQIRNLEQIPSYIKDNQNFYQDFINEAKPYRTKLREYVPQYSNIDTATGIWTDFDLPGRYDFDTGTFRSPDIRIPADQQLITTDTRYTDWNDHYKFKLTGFLIANSGVNYTTPPTIEISGGGGSGAAATAYINLSTGSITSIVVTDPGSGYTSTPTIYINGVGSGAVVYPVLRNEFDLASPELSYNTVRSISSTLKFDRINYSSNLVVWDANVIYSNTVVAGSGSNLYITSGNIVVYNNEAYLVTNANVTTESVFDFSRYTKINPGNSLLTATDRISAFYTSVPGRQAKDYAQLMSGIEYPGTRVFGQKFDANSFTVTSNVIGFNYNGLRITSANIQQVDFLELGFDLNQPIRVEALVPFAFKNNGIFSIISVDRNEMMITGKPVETVYQLTLGESITANAGDYITQLNATGNAYIAESVTNSKTISFVYQLGEFTESANVISINGLITGANVQDITSTGTIPVKISNLYTDGLLDSNIYSTFLDTALGTRPEDINIVGGAYVDIYSSHAPEELVPGRMYDALEMRVFSNNTANTATYGSRTFQTMNGEIEFTRISAASTTRLASNLNIADTVIHVEDASILPEPGAIYAVPGVVFINGEKIHYYQRYDAARMSTAIPWQSNTVFATGALVFNVDSNVYAVTGNIYANNTSYINKANIQANVVTPWTVNTAFSIGSLITNIDVENDIFVVTGNVYANSATYINTANVQLITVTPWSANTSFAEGSFISGIDSNIYLATGNIYAYRSWEINSTKLQPVSLNTLAQLRRGVDGTGSADVYTTGTLVADSSLTQLIPGSGTSTATVSGNLKVTDKVTYTVNLSSPITANIGDYITQYGNTANVRILETISNGNVAVVNLISGNLTFATNTAYKVNVVARTGGFTTTDANVVAMSILGQVQANGNVVLGSTTVTQSNLWIPVGTGAGLEGSTIAGAEFIKAQVSYIP